MSYLSKATELVNKYTNQSGTGNRFNWSNGGTSVVLYSGNYLNFLTNPTATSETRLSAAKRVVKDIFDRNPGIKFGLMLFNKNLPAPHGGYVAMRVGALNETVTYNSVSMTRLDALKAIIDGIRPRAFGDLCDGSGSQPADCADGSLSYYGTPLAETLWEAKQYFSGGAPKYGYPSSGAPTPAPDPAAKNATNYISPFNYTCQQAYIIYVTDGNPWTSTDDTDANNNIDSLTNIGSFNNAYAVNNKSSKLDELARWMYTNDLVSNTILDKNQRIITYTVAFGLGATDPDDVAGTQLLQETALNGGGKNYAASNADALSTAIQNALIEINTTNSSFAAPSLSVNAFNKLFNRDEVYFALFKPSTTELWDGNVKKFKLCADTTGTSCTFGEIIDKNNTPAIDPVTQRIKDTSVSYWGTVADGGNVTAGGAGAQIPAVASRKLYTYRGSYSGLSNTSPATLSLIAASAGNALFDAAVTTPSILGLTASGSTATDTTNVTNLINWMLGQDSYDKDQDGSTVDPRWAHSDPLHSRPVAITYGGTASSPIIKLFYASNDGVLRMVNDNNGQEEWAFVPSELLQSQYGISRDAEGDHKYGLDGTVTFWIKDVDNDGIIEPASGDFVYVFFGMRRGGRNIYALNVTPTTTLTSPSTVGGITPKLMWAITGGSGDYLKLAQTWSKPAITNIRFGCTGAGCGTDDSSAETVMIFGGGYDTTEDPAMPVQTTSNKVGNAIYIVDPKNGSRLWWASDSADSAGTNPTLTLARMNFSIPSDLTLMDSNGDGETDRIYVGDTSGQLFRIDLGTTLKTNSNGGTVGYVFADIGCEGGTRPNCTATLAKNRRKFFYPVDVAQVNDATFEDPAESKYDIVTISSGDREDPLDNLTSALSTDPVHNRIYAFRDVSVDSLAGTTPPSAPLTDADLYDATLNDLQDPNDVAKYDNAIGQIKLKKGWFIELKETGVTAPAGAPSTWPWVGEKGLAKEVIFGGAVYITTYTPANDQTAAVTCSATEGTAKLYALNVLNGTAIADYNNSGTITTTDRSMTLGGGIPSELVTVIREGGTSGLVGTSGGAARPQMNSSLPRFKTFWYEE